MSKIRKAAIATVLMTCLAGCQSVSQTGSSTHTSNKAEAKQTTVQDTWKQRVASARELRQKRILEVRERRLAAAEARKAAIKARKQKSQESRKVALERLNAKKVSSSKKPKATKSLQTSKKTDGNKKDELRVGWAKIDGKYVYRNAKKIEAIKAEREAARKAAEVAAQKAARAAKARKLVAKQRSAPRKANPKGSYGKLIAKYAAQNGVPYRLARAVVQVESSFRPNVTGGVGEIGLMQIRLSTARGMGYKGTAKQLYNPATNLYWGMKYLGKAHRLAGGATCGTILKYNAGHGAKRMNPISQRYCDRVRRII